MPYLIFDSFKQGVDRSRPREALGAEKLWSGTNGHITRGGDFEKRKAFVAKYSLPAGETVGLARDADGLVVFGIAAAPSSPLPSGVMYQQVVHPTAPATAISRINDWDLFGGEVYVVVLYANGDYRNFLDGTVVADWGGGSPNPDGYGLIAHTHGRKVYAPDNTDPSVLWFSKLDVGDVFDTGQTGSGFEAMNTHSGDAESVTALADYQDKVAVFSRRVVQIWTMAVDPAENARAQVIFNTGTRAPRSALGYGDLDTFYLADSGIRSLRARNYTNTAGVNDVGTPIDRLVKEYLATLTSTQIERAQAIVDPDDDRFWLVVGNRIFVFSYFPTAKIGAWTVYEPGFEFTDIVSFGGRVYARAGDTIYLYGGDDDETYDSCPVTLETPFVGTKKELDEKDTTMADVITTGTWYMTLHPDPRDADQVVHIGEVSGVTSVEPDIAVEAHTTHFAVKLYHEAAGAASVSKIAIHFQS